MIKCYAHVQRCHNETHYSVEIIYTNKVIKVQIAVVDNEEQTLANGHRTAVK